jgi:hypothetical protein
MSPCTRRPRVTTSWLGLILVVVASVPAAVAAGGPPRASTPPASPAQQPAAAASPGAARAVFTDATNPRGSIGRLAVPDDWRHAESELEARGIRRGSKEFRYRMQVLQNVWNTRDIIDFPDLPEKEKRNEAFWTLRDGVYVVRDDRQPVDAILDLWKWKTSGIMCWKLAHLTLLKTRIDFADDQERARLNSLLHGKTIPEELPGNGEGIYFRTPQARAGLNHDFETTELLPGDEVRFKNLYFDRINRATLTEQQKVEYRGDEGSNFFYGRPVTT